MRHINLFQACVTHELVEVPEGDAAVVGRRGKNVVVAAEEQHGDHAGVMTKVTKLDLNLKKVIIYSYKQFINKVSVTKS